MIEELEIMEIVEIEEDDMETNDDDDEPKDIGVADENDDAAEDIIDALIADEISSGSHEAIHDALVAQSLAVCAFYHFIFFVG